MPTSRKAKNAKSLIPTSIKISPQVENAIVFNGSIRRTLVEGVLQDIKGYFEARTDGLVEVTYEDYALKNHEFGFKMHAKKTDACSKQMFLEATGSIVDAVNYMFAGDSDQYDVCIFTKKNDLEIEIVSNW